MLGRLYEAKKKAYWDEKVVKRTMSNNIHINIFISKYEKHSMRHSNILSNMYIFPSMLSIMNFKTKWSVNILKIFSVLFKVIVLFFMQPYIFVAWSESQIFHPLFFLNILNLCNAYKLYLKYFFLLILIIIFVSFMISLTFYRQHVKLVYLKSSFQWFFPCWCINKNAYRRRNF